MITPRQTRLVRVPNLATFAEVLTDTIAGLDPLEAAGTFVIVPTRAAGEQLRQTVEDRWLSPAEPALLWPRVGTRADLYRDLAARSGRPASVLVAVDREVILSRVAREVAKSGIEPPFERRPALVAEMIALYDYIRRQARTLADFERNVTAELEPAADTDRGAAALLAQTKFLTAVFDGYEKTLAEQGLVDEHGVRQSILASPSADPLRHVVIAVADRVADPDGLWPVDFTMLSTLTGLERVDVVATEALVAAGFLERIHAALPEIEERSVDGSRDQDAPPVLHVPSLDGPAVFQSRDREEELADVARRIKADRLAGAQVPLHRTALVVKRPLPYLYLARAVFGDAGIPFEALDTLPLAAEPYAAALDLVLDFVGTGYTRRSAAALLASPHFRFELEGQPLAGEAVAALDRALAESRYLGGLDRLSNLAVEWAAIDVPASREERRRHEAAPAAALVRALAEALDPLAESRPIPGQLAVLLGFLDRYHREPDPSADLVRLARVRRAVRTALETLSRAYQRHDPVAEASVHDISSTIRRWLGAQTFAVGTGTQGLRILDFQAARFADVDDVQLVGLVEGEWPERERRSIFYPPSLLSALEPSPAAQDPSRGEHDRLRAARASFADLVGLARRRVRVSTFALESDAVVEPSPFVDDLSRLKLERAAEGPRPFVRVFRDEALARVPVVVDGLAERPASWARLRLEGPAPGDPRFQGEAGPWVLPRISATRVDRYLKCPFQFFASEVLKLEEEPEDEDIRPPWERGRFLHGLFETFFSEWQALGKRRIDADDLPEARRLLIEICERALAGLPDAEAALERLRLHGSAASPGIIDRVLSLEVERTEVIDRRLIEFPLDDVFAFRNEGGGTRPVPLRAKIDRVDLLADGSFRVIDYKSRFVPDFKTSVQLQAYTTAVGQQLARTDRPREVHEALYLSLEGESPVKVLKPAKGESLDDALRQAEIRFVQTLDDIAAGHFPVRPVPRSICWLCPFDAVCRKAFVEAADD